MLTLIIPIGGPGAGKSTLGQNLKQELPEVLDSKARVFTTCRDDLFARAKSENPDMSLRKLRKHLFDVFKEFRTSVANWRSENPRDSIIVYLDSANSQRGGRKFMIDEFQPDRVVLVNLKREREVLLQRVQEREEHPTFPTEYEKQIEIIDKIQPNLEYAGDEDISWNSSEREVIIIEK